MAERKILVVGGGIAGLVLAVALRRRGVAVDVAELQPEWNILGVGISLTPPTLRALAAIGLLEPCRAAAFGFDRILFGDAAGGRLAEMGMPRLAGPDCPATLAIGRPALHRILIEAATGLGARIRMGTTVSALEARGAAASVRFSTGEAASYDYVVGCDGAHSAVRGMLFADVPPPDFTGLAVWRATMPRPPAVACMEMFYGPRTKAGVNPHAPDEMFLFLVEKTAEGRRLSRAERVPVLRDLLADFAGPTMEYVRAHTADPDAIDYRPMSAFLLAPPWHKGRAIVIGDAAHTTTPHLATGAGIAIEDAVVLAELIGADGGEGGGGAAGAAAAPDPEEMFGAFMARRYDRCRLVVETAVRLGEMEKDPTIPVQAHFDLMTATFRRLGEPI